MFCALFELNTPVFSRFTSREHANLFGCHFFHTHVLPHHSKAQFLRYCGKRSFRGIARSWKVTLDRVPWFERHVENLGDVIMCDGFDNRTHSKIDVRLCSITESSWTIGVRLGSTEFWFDFFRLDTPEPLNECAKLFLCKILADYEHQESYASSWSRSFARGVMLNQFFVGGKYHVFHHVFHIIKFSHVLLSILSKFLNISFILLQHVHMLPTKTGLEYAALSYFLFVLIWSPTHVVKVSALFVAGNAYRACLFGWIWRPDQ